MNNKLIYGIGIKATDFDIHEYKIIKEMPNTLKILGEIIETNINKYEVYDNSEDKEDFIIYRTKVNKRFFVKKENLQYVLEELIKIFSKRIEKLQDTIMQCQHLIVEEIKEKG